MKQTVNTIIAFVFLAVSVWLSFTVKKANSEIAKKNRQLQQSEEQNR
jgi:preprotein translocase subunit SecG